MNPISAVRDFVYYLSYPFRMLARLPASIISAPGRFLGMTLPTRVALVVGFSLFIVSIVYFVLKALNAERVDWWPEFVGEMLIVLLLIVIISIVARIVVKTWLEKDYSRFPEIDEAWKAGMSALRNQGIEIVDTPVFLLLGVGSKYEADALFRGAAVPLCIDGEPYEKGWLHWYATTEAVYLVLTQACRLGALKAKMADTGDTLDHGSDLIRQTINPDANVRGTAESVQMEERDARALRGTDSDSGEISVRGTMMVKDPSHLSDLGATWGGGSAYSLSIDEGSEFTSRLEYVCQRLKRERQPVCPCNGILTLLPFEIIKKGESEGIEVQRATKADLDAIRQALALRCPVTALVSGMESEPGFRELVRRVGLKRAKHQRFGHKFNIWNPPIPDQVQALAAHACKAFEDFTYTLFREKDGLTQFGNRKLYSLLCCVRSTLRTRLTNILVGAFADEKSDPYGKDQKAGDNLLFGGCYFAATGDTEDRQAFIKAVVEKLSDQQGELDWSESALNEDRRFHHIAQTTLLVDGLLFFGLIGIWVFRLLGQS